MSIHYAYDLCDAMEYFAEGQPPLPEHTELLYVGSYFCDRYYCSTSPRIWEECFAVARDRGVAAVLVIPTPSQALLGTLKKQTHALMDAYGELIQEVVVNDSGMLEWVTVNYPEIGIWLGRTMDKELRDPRYYLPGIHGKLLEQVEHRWHNRWKILGVESDVTQLSPNDYPISHYGLGIHVPFAYLTMGRICEFGSIGLPAGEKFQLYRPCNRQCMSHWMWFEQNAQCFLKHGRAVYIPVFGELGETDSANIRMIESVLAAKVGTTCPGEKGESL